MKIPPYWSRQTYTGADRSGRSRSASAWGWSFESQTAAEGDATAKAKRVFELIVSDRLPDARRRDEYDYLERPLREEIVEAVKHDGREIAVITRNRYGALVLNSAEVCFVDVDFPRSRGRGFIDALMLAISASKRAERARVMEKETLQEVRDWGRRHPTQSFRLYRTAAGLRLLFTDRLYNPTAAETVGLLEELGSDELYRRLTEKQESFRARLTPKPWRCGCRRPPNFYPREQPKADAAYRQWLREYETKGRGYGVCQFMEAIGHPSTNGCITAVVELHDRYTCRRTQTALA